MRVRGRDDNSGAYQAPGSPAELSSGWGNGKGRETIKLGGPEIRMESTISVS